MTGVFIDALNQKLSDLELPEEPAAFIQKAAERIDGKMFSHLAYFDNGDVLCGDPDARKNGKTYGFYLKGLDLPIWGNAIVLGLDNGDDEISARSKLSEVSKILTFVAI